MTSAPPPFQHPGPPPSLPELPEGAPPPATAPGAPGGLPPLGAPVWSPFAALLLVFAAVLFLSLLAGAAVGLGGGDVDGDATGLSLVLTAAQAVLLVAVPFLLVQAITGRRPAGAAFGLERTPALRALGWIGLAYAGFWVIAIAVQLVLGEPDDQQLVQEIKEEESLVVLGAFGVLSCVLAPLAEEFFFRGFLFRALAERMHWLWAALVSGAVFGVIHAGGSPATSLVVLAAFGVALAFLFWYTRSLLPCIVLHAFNNAVSFGFTKELPWWGVLLLICASVGTTLGMSLLAVRLAGRRSPAPA